MLFQDLRRMTSTHTVRGPHDLHVAHDFSQITQSEVRIQWYSVRKTRTRKHCSSFLVILAIFMISPTFPTTEKKLRIANDRVCLDR